MKRFRKRPDRGAACFALCPAGPCNPLLPGRARLPTVGRMSPTFACSCGATQWQVAPPGAGTHLVCYCADCQTFPRHLGADILTDCGGTGLVQVAPSQVTFTRGAENLRLLKLSPKGVSRWYTGCCKTPVANTLASAKLPFVSLMTAPFTGEAKALGPVRAHVNTVYAKGPGKPAKDRGLGLLMWNFAVRLSSERFSGRWKETPFFAPPDWAPVAEPQILTREERNRARP